jgi:hypothetical protein
LVHIIVINHVSRQSHMFSGSRGVLALALTSSLVKAASYSIRQANNILRNGSTSAHSASASEYELLKKSRPFRIRARLVPTNDERDDAVGSYETSKIVHFQRHAQGEYLAVLLFVSAKPGLFSHVKVFMSRSGVDRDAQCNL